MRIGILGTGTLAAALGEGWARAGHEVAIGGRSQVKAENLAERGSRRRASAARAAAPGRGPALSSPRLPPAGRRRTERGTSPRETADTGRGKPARAGPSEFARPKVMPPPGALRLRDGSGRRSRVPAGSWRASWAPIPTTFDPGRAEQSRPRPQARSYSGAFHLDARDHARSTVCGPRQTGWELG
ncbi:NAD(P)-binding domain-containing protein [Streptomyces sp. NPDC051664]|uniref:NAD(P)-binding domain-containing protein n=1 Tax=Streptomyces sp. NPDC051664 TaxID=3365668 RepID=UPI0037B14500